MKIPDTTITALYGPEDSGRQRRRYRDLLRAYTGSFEKPQPALYPSSPGRTELGGNHTDHNGGRVLCAAVSRDTVALCGRRADNRVRLRTSALPGLIDVKLEDLDPHPEERGTPHALIRGVAAGFRREGFAIGGFSAIIHGEVGIGSGLSSSASFEVLLGGILAALYNDGRVDRLTLAQIGRRAENDYFGKPCGLMDQAAAALGGVLALDFEEENAPTVVRVPADFPRSDYVLAVVHTGAGHEGLTDAYAAIPAEMKAVAALFGQPNLRGVSERAFRARLDEVCRRAGDRAALRALHFFTENRRVGRMVEALAAGRFDDYLRLAAESGASSAGLLQNTLPPEGSGRSQPAALALALSHDFLSRAGRGACRIHGGGFAGTIQAYIHRDDLRSYEKLMTPLFGKGAVEPLRIRAEGVTTVA